jgi:hypothetical protein
LLALGEAERRELELSLGDRKELPRAMGELGKFLQLINAERLLVRTAKFRVTLGSR